MEMTHQEYVKTRARMTNIDDDGFPYIYPCKLYKSLESPSCVVHNIECVKCLEKFWNEEVCE